MSEERTVDHGQLSRVLRDFAATLVGIYDLDEVLSKLGEDIAAVVGVAGAGVMVEGGDGELHFVSASNEVLRELERLQIEHGEGPCLLAYRTGETVIAADLAEDERFPEFGPRAIEAGMRSVYSFPLSFGKDTVGALNLYDDAASGLDGERLEACRTLADVATIYLLHSREVEADKQLSAQLEHALGSRVPIEQAKGFVAASRGIHTDEARDLLRDFARRNQLKLRDVAQAVVAGELDVDEL